MVMTSIIIVCLLFIPFFSLFITFIFIDIAVCDTFHGKDLVYNIISKDKETIKIYMLWSQ